MIPNRKEYKVDGTNTPMNLFSRFTSDLATSNVPFLFASSFHSSHEANLVKKRVVECLEGATLPSPHLDKWPHYNFFGKGGLFSSLSSVVVWLANSRVKFAAFQMLRENLPCTSPYSSYTCVIHCKSDAKQEGVQGG